MWILNFTIAAFLLWQWSNYKFNFRESMSSNVITWGLIVGNIVFGVLLLMI